MECTPPNVRINYAFIEFNDLFVLNVILMMRPERKSNTSLQITALHHACKRGASPSQSL
jgi:hypothetical protein